jgi:hypothetical protein
MELAQQLRDVRDVVEYARASAAAGGARTTPPALRRSSIVVLLAALERFVEQLAMQSVEALLEDEAATPDYFPASLRTAIGSALKGADAWQLARDGWKTVLRSYAKRQVYGRNFNNPSWTKINSLFASMLGIEDILATCGWRNYPAETLKDHLEDLVELRNEIAHTGRMADDREPLHLQGIESWADWLERLGDRLDDVVRVALSERLGHSPW